MNLHEIERLHEAFANIVRAHGDMAKRMNDLLETASAIAAKNERLAIADEVRGDPDAVCPPSDPLCVECGHRHRIVDWDAIRVCVSFVFRGKP